MALPSRRAADLLAGLLAVSVVVSAPVEGQQPPQRPPLRPEPVTRLDPGPQSTDLDAPRRLSMAFARPVAIRDLLLLLVADTPFSVALDPDVAGSFVGDLKDITLRQALDSVLTPRALAYSVDGTLIRVFPRRTESRFFDVNFVNVRRAWKRTIGDSTGTFDSVTASDPYEDVERGIASMLSPAGKVHVDRRGGLANVTDYPDSLGRVAVYLEALQLRSSRQVRLQARLVDAVMNRTVQLPETIALNNEPAVIRATARDESLALTIVPQIATDGVIQLSLSPSVSEGDVRSALADTVSQVRDGGTVSVGLAPGLVMEVTATIAVPQAAGGAR